MRVRVCERERKSAFERERGREKRAATKLLHNIISTHARKTLNDDLPIVVSDASVRIDRFSTSRIAFSTSWFCQFQLDCYIICTHQHRLWPLRRFWSHRHHWFCFRALVSSS